MKKYCKDKIDSKTSLKTYLNMYQRMTKIKMIDS